MKNFLVLGLFTAMLVNLSAQNKLDEDRNAIKAMAGCYKVTFNFAETFSPDTAYVKHEGERSWAYELVKILDDKPDHIVLQHLLVVDAGPKTMVQKHWRQDWDYQNTDFYQFYQFNPETNGQEWKYQKLMPAQVKGQWSQKVFQVDDSPRYEGTATWVHYDGRHYWDNTTDAPLPRREHTTRNDYNVIERTNRQELTDFGWVHDQDNTKILRANGEDKIIAYEKGYNTYEKVDASHCEPAEKWWTENEAIWANVRTAWDNTFAKKKDLALWPQKGAKTMFKPFFELKPGSTVQDVEKIIAEFSKGN